MGKKKKNAWKDPKISDKRNIHKRRYTSDNRGKQLHISKSQKIKKTKQAK